MTDSAITLRLRELRPANADKGYVPARIYDIVLEDEAVGHVVLRIGDNDALRRYAGHIGYQVEPQHRGRGYAAAAVRLLLPIARRAGMQELWITCVPDNRASRRTLEKLEASYVETVDLPEVSDMYARGERQKCRYHLPL
ncbi:MAG: GNAT family N-acetyltransferase [Pseudomonadota bacterium]